MSMTTGDDFRLWCLGLSGSYRASATFSERQLSEARAIRQKIIRFLQEGEMWVASASETNSKMWTDRDTSLFKLSNEVWHHGRLALQNDLHGANFVKEIMRLVESCNSYLSTVQEGPTEAMKAALYNIRQLLALVGFSKHTTEIGLNSSKAVSDSSTAVSADQNTIVGEMVYFRSAVRRLALESALGAPQEEQMKRMLHLCDEARKSMLQNGVKIVDSKSADSDDWRFCLPRSVEREGASTKEQRSQIVDLMSTSVHDLFRVGKYEGFFSGFSDDGMPTLNADGSEISKRMLKKLKKKREAHLKRLRNSL